MLYSVYYLVYNTVKATCMSTWPHLASHLHKSMCTLCWVFPEPGAKSLLRKLYIAQKKGWCRGGLYQSAQKIISIQNNSRMNHFLVIKSLIMNFKGVVSIKNNANHPRLLNPPMLQWYKARPACFSRFRFFVGVHLCASNSHPSWPRRAMYMHRHASRLIKGVCLHWHRHK